MPNQETVFHLELEQPESEAKALMLHLHNKNQGNLTTDNSGRNVRYSYPDGTSFGQMGKDLLDQALSDTSQP